MYPNDPKTLDGFWPHRNQSRLPYAPYRTPNWVTPWVTPGEQVRYEADCAAGKPNRYGPNDIEYRYNRQGFRCIDFDQIPKDSYVALSVGDSNTEGIGLPVAHTWSHLLCEKLRPLVNSEVCNLNLGLGASSNQHIAIRTCRAMQSPELHPDAVFIAWTYSHRLFYVYEDGELMDWPFPTDMEMKSTDPKIKTKRLYFEQLQSEKFDLSNLMANIMLVQAVADLRGTRVCHSFLSQSIDAQDWLSKRVDGLLGLPQEERNARDLMHFGLEHNEWSSTLMLDWFKTANLSAKGTLPK
ncbi:MAG: hypothetical protein K9G48_03395 [Reyranella sp.]|nr:hypothetical protein [Reyranella sp.]